MGAIYVSNADSGDVHTLAQVGNGPLSLLQVVSIGGTLGPMAQSPCGRWLHVARRSEPLAVVTLAIDPSHGRLRKHGEVSLPGSMAYLSTDQTGRFLFAASYQSDLVSVSPIAEKGTVGPVQQVISTGRHAHAILASPSNRHVLVTSLGGGQVLQFHFDASTGQLTPNAVPAWNGRAGSGPRHLRFHPNGFRVYLLNELDASIDVLAFDSVSGTLRHEQTVSSLPAGFSGEPWAADLHLTPDGLLLYSSERRSSTLVAFAVHPSTGQLQLLGHTPTEAQPRGFAITPDGGQLLAVGQQSHHMSRYRIDRRTGSLTLEQRLPMGQNPNWIEVCQ